MPEVQRKAEQGGRGRRSKSPSNHPRRTNLVPQKTQKRPHDNRNKHPPPILQIILIILSELRPHKMTQRHRQQRHQTNQSPPTRTQSHPPQQHRRHQKQPKRNRRMGIPLKNIELRNQPTTKPKQEGQEKNSHKYRSRKTRTLPGSGLGRSSTQKARLNHTKKGERPVFSLIPVSLLSRRHPGSQGFPHH